MVPVLPEEVPQANYNLIKKVASKLLRVAGWKIVGQLPTQRKVIIAIAPHTSNWDFVISVLAMFALNLKVTFMGKKSIFIWPFKNLLKSMGGVPIDRTHAHGVVGQMVDLFHRKSSMVLALAPEGTRSKTYSWKTGFLIIAKKARVPIVPVSLDFNKKEVRFHSAHFINRSIEQELTVIQQQFEGVCAKNPHLV